MRIQANDKTIVMKTFWQICFCLVLLFCIAAIIYAQASQSRREIKSSHPQVVAPSGIQAASRTPVGKSVSQDEFPCITQAKYLSVPQGTILTYRICHVPDIDQKRGWGRPPLIRGLPNKGMMYCLPTSAMNWMAYIANHGYPQVQPYPGDWQLGPPGSVGVYNEMSQQLINMGMMMGTDPEDGTTDGGKARKAMQDWLDNDAPGHFVVSVYGASGSYSPTFADMAVSAISGNLIMPVIGWYPSPDSSSDHIRDGGHIVSLVAGNQDPDLARYPLMGIHDPANDNQLTTQSIFATDSYGITNVYGTFGYEDDNHVIHTFQRTQSRVIGYGSGYIDAYFAISPKYVLTASDDSLILIKFIKLLVGSDQPERMTFHSATGGRVTDLAIHPEQTKHPYLVEDSDAIWQIDTLTGLSSRFAAVKKPKRIVFGGPDQNLYALLQQHLICLDRNGAQRQIALLRTPLDAIAFDESKKRLVGVSREARQLFFFDTDLNPMGSAALPAVPGDGSVRLSVNPVDGTIWLRADGSVSLLRLRSNVERLEPMLVELEAAQNSVGLYADERGHVFVSEDGRLAEFDSDGRRVMRSPFIGQPAGALLQMLRPFSNFDPETMSGRSFRNVLPEDAQR